jgi:hypothetical protein
VHADPDHGGRPGVAAVACGGAALAAAVGVIYCGAAVSYFFNDDFHWLQGARRFEAANLLRIDRYDHFYRPVIEIYFHLGSQVFGCAALPFHLASIVIHLLCTLTLFLFARALTGCLGFAFLTALYFSVQPGYVEAVAWVAAITDLLPALWYLLTLWLHLLFLQGRGARFYALSLVTFTACLLTHESSATLAPMMVALEATLLLQAGSSITEIPTATRAVRYAPFIVLLAAFLAIAYVVNSRSYLVTDGHYRFGWHAVPHMFHYIVALSVWKRATMSYVVIAVLVAAAVVRGDARLRFFVLWIAATLAPASFFTWGIESRYLYLPAAGFALVLADLTIKGRALAMRALSPRIGRALAVGVVLGLSIRFGVFAYKGAQDFRERTRPYERLAAVVRASNPAPATGEVIRIDHATAASVPELYLTPALETIYCRADVRAATP